MKGKVNKKVIVGGLLVVLVGVFVIGALLKPNDSKNLVGDKKSQVVKVEKATIRDIQTKVSATGTLEAETSETIYAETTSKIHRVEKKVGDSVKIGDVLITLDKETHDKLAKEVEKLELQIETSNMQLDQLMGEGSKQEILQARANTADLQKGQADIEDKIRSMKANLKTQETTLNTVKTTYELEEQLFAEGISSKQALEAKKVELDNAQEQLTTTKYSISSLEKELENMKIKKEAADYNLSVLLNTTQDANKARTIQMKQNEIKSINLQLDTLKNDLAKASETIVATMDGVVSAVNVQDGGAITQGSPLMTIVKTAPLIVKAEVSPFYAAQIVPGLAATVKYTGSQTIEVAGTVKRVSPTAIQKAGVGANGAVSTVIPIEIELTEESAGLKPGLVVDVRVITKDIKGAVTVPLLATMEEKDVDPYLYIVKEDNTLEKRTVEQGAADNLAIEIKNMKEGEMVVINPTENLKDGMPVAYEKPEAKDEAGEKK